MSKIVNEIVIRIENDEEDIKETYKMIEYMTEQILENWGYDEFEIDIEN